MRIGYFPGCSLLGSSREYDESFRAIAPLLGLELVEIPDWNCCGASAAHNLSHLMAVALPARVLALAREAALDQIVVPCSACYARLATTRDGMEKDETLRAEIASIIEMSCDDPPEILNVLDALALVSAEDIAARTTTPFARKVVCYYGCYLVRPPKLTGEERTEDPQQMDEMMKRVGAQPLDWAFKVECCGAGFSVSRTGTVARLSGNIVEDAAVRGAEVIVVACPMCHTNLDLRRPEIEKHLGASIDIPVMYISQVLGKAFGLSDRELGLHRHNVPVKFANEPTQKIPVVVEAPKPAAPAGTGA